MPSDSAEATTHSPAAPKQASVYCPVVSRMTPATVAAIAAPIWCEANTQKKTIVPSLPNARRHKRCSRRHGRHPVQPVDHDEHHHAGVHGECQQPGQDQQSDTAR